MGGRQPSHSAPDHLVALADMMSTAVAIACAGVGPGEVRDYCRVTMPVADLPQVGKSLLRAVMQQRPEGTRMSARAYHR